MSIPAVLGEELFEFHWKQVEVLNYHNLIEESQELAAFKITFLRFNYELRECVFYVCCKDSSKLKWPIDG